MTSREAAILALGVDAVRDYERVKTFYTRYGHALELTYAEAVGGRIGDPGEPDVITPLGGFEFCAQASTKNAAGDAAQRGKVPAGHVVQVSGSPRPGRITGTDFLKLHGVRKPDRIANECEIRALEIARAEADAAAARWAA